jgi:hypothetical protein
VCEETDQSEQRDNVELNFLRPVRHPFRQRMERPEEDTKTHDTRDDKRQRDIEEHVGVARCCNEKRKVRRRYRISWSCQRPVSQIRQAVFKIDCWVAWQSR